MIARQMATTIPHQANLLVNLKSVGAMAAKWPLGRRIKEKKWLIVMFADHRGIPCSINQFRPCLLLGVLQQQSNSVGHGGGTLLTQPPIEDEFLFWTNGNRCPCCRFFRPSRPLFRAGHGWADANSEYNFMQLHTKLPWWAQPHFSTTTTMERGAVKSFDAC